MDSAHGKDFVLTDYAKNVIKFKSHQLGQRRDFQSIEPEDLQQELWLALVKAAEQFDPAKASLDTFIDRVVNTAVAMLVRARRRLKCVKGIRADSLDDVNVSKSDSPELRSEAVSADDLARRTGVKSRDEASQREDAEVVEQALAQMPVEMRDLCRRLMGGTVASVARELGVSRRQVRKTVADARPFFEEAGFNFEWRTRRLATAYVTDVEINETDSGGAGHGRFHSVRVRAARSVGGSRDVLAPGHVRGRGTGRPGPGSTGRQLPGRWGRACHRH